MKSTTKQSGFTAVELLITLFVAAAFLIASYQLFNLVVKDGGATRAQSRAANVAYDYLRQYAASSTTIPCTTSNPVNNVPLTIDGLTNVTISVTVSCLPDAVSSLSKVESVISYNNNPVQQVKYATFTSSTGSSGTADITTGLVAWWKFNGNANNSIGTPNGVQSNTTSATGQNGQNDNAYAFNGSNSIVTTGSTFNLGSTNVSISCWIYNPTSTNKGLFVHVGTYTGFGIGMGNTSGDTTGNKLVMIYEGIRWIPTTGTLSVGWHHVVMVVDGSSTPTAYIDGVSAGSYGGTAMSAAASGTSTAIGALTTTSADNFTGSVDDVRLYSRALPQSDILALYSAGAK